MLRAVASATMMSATVSISVALLVLPPTGLFRVFFVAGVTLVGSFFAFLATAGAETRFGGITQKRQIADRRVCVNLTAKENDRQNGDIHPTPLAASSVLGLFPSLFLHNGTF